MKNWIVIGLCICLIFLLGCTSSYDDCHTDCLEIYNNRTCYKIFDMAELCGDFPDDVSKEKCFDMCRCLKK